MRTRNLTLTLAMTIAALFCFAVNAQSQATMDPPHDLQGCISCHDMTAFSDPNMIPGGNETVYQDICLGCHTGGSWPEGSLMTGHSGATTSIDYYGGAWEVGCSVCHNQHVQPVPPVDGVGAKGGFIRSSIDLSRIENGSGVTLGKTGYKRVVLLARTGPKSFADGDLVYDGLCEVCHTLTKYFQHDGTATVDQNHGGKDGDDCMVCHTHGSGFKGGGVHDFIIDDTATDGSPACSSCHTGYDTFPETAHSACSVCHTTAPTLTDADFFLYDGQPDDDGNSMFDNLLTKGYGNFTTIPVRYVTDPITDPDGDVVADGVDIDPDVPVVGAFDAIKCGFCHAAKPGDLDNGEHGGHLAAHFDSTGITCIGCHDDGGLGVVEGIHGNTCLTCHDNAQGGTDTTIVGAKGNGDARLGAQPPLIDYTTATCITCHGGATYRYDTDFTIHDKGDHKTKALAEVLTATASCTTNCHDGSSAANIVTNTHNDTCTNCHTNTTTDGQLKAGVSNGTAASHTIDSASTCTSCHGAPYDYDTQFQTAHDVVDHSGVGSTGSCATCHTGDNVTSTLTHSNTCATCHTNITTDGSLVNGTGAGSPAAATVIGDASGHDITVTSTCADCHATRGADFTAHSVKDHSRVVTTTSCASCHTGNIISSTLTHGGTCTTCHTNTSTDGSLLDGTGAGSPAAATVIGDASGHVITADSACAACHATRGADFTAHSVKDHDGVIANAAPAGIADDCVSCHTGDFITAVASGSDPGTHQNTCATCHTNTSTDGSLLDGSGAGSPQGATVVGDATAHVITAASDCDSCHSGSGYFDGHQVHDASTHDIAQRATDLSGATLCNVCHGVGGTTNTTKFTAAWDDGSANDVYGVHTTTCIFCHDSTRTNVSNPGTLKAAQDSVQKVIQNVTTVGCLDCHFDRAASHMDHLTYDGGAGAGVVTESIRCTQCHTGGGTPGSLTDAELMSIHSDAGPGCGTCHVASGGSGPLVDKLLGGTYASESKDYETDNENGGECIDCHGDYGSNFNTAHSVVDHSGVGTTGSCASCHTGNIISSTLTHGDTCTTCHTNTSTDGRLLDGTGAGSPAAATVIGDASGHDITVTSTCADCHATRGADFTAHSVKDHDGVASTATVETTIQSNDCNDCHSGSVIAAAINHNDTCVTCHTNTTTDGSLVDGTSGSSPAGTTVIGDASGHTLGSTSECTTCHAAGYFANGANHSDGTSNSGVHTVSVGSDGCDSCHAGDWESWANILDRHDQDPTTADACRVCHDSTRTDNTTGTVGVQVIITNNALRTGTVTCLACHTDRAAGHGGHDNTHFAYSAACSGCHADLGSGLVVDVHGNDCNICHIGTPGTGTARTAAQVDTTDGVDGAANLGNGDSPHASVTCLTCHVDATYPAPTIHHDSAAALNGLCHGCHDQTLMSSTAPRQMACRECHVDDTQTGVKVLSYRLSKGSGYEPNSMLNTGGGGTAGIDASAYVTSHTITHTSTIDIYDYVACMDCHSRTGEDGYSAVRDAPVVAPFHGFPGDVSTEMFDGSGTMKTMIGGGTAALDEISQGDENNLFPLVFVYYHPGHNTFRRFGETQKMTRRSARSSFADNSELYRVPGIDGDKYNGATIEVVFRDAPDLSGFGGTSWTPSECVSGGGGFTITCEDLKTANAGLQHETPVTGYALRVANIPYTNFGVYNSGGYDDVPYFVDITHPAAWPADARDDSVNATVITTTQLDVMKNDLGSAIAITGIDYTNLNANCTSTPPVENGGIIDITCGASTGAMGSFDYTITGDTGPASTATVTITVIGNQAPRFGVASYTMGEAIDGYSYSLQGQSVAGYAFDPEGDAITYSKVGGTCTWATVAANGALSGTPTSPGACTVTAQAAATGGTDTAILNITVYTWPPANSGGMTLFNGGQENWDVGRNPDRLQLEIDYGSGGDRVYIVLNGTGAPYEMMCEDKGGGEYNCQIEDNAIASAGYDLYIVVYAEGASAGVFNAAATYTRTVSDWTISQDPLGTP